MNTKLKTLINRLVQPLSQFEAVECIALNEAADTDVLDSYFALILDVYYTGMLPSIEKRRHEYGVHDVFETSPSGEKDRFIVGEIPVRIEYKLVEKIEKAVDCACGEPDGLWQIKNSGTYGFYRIVNGTVLFSRTGWIDTIIGRINAIPDSFWNKMQSYYQSTMEHYLMDLGAAVVQDDPFHYMISSAGFIKSLCGVVFMHNHCFEPSHRAYNTRITHLEHLPSSFAAYFESFLRPDSEMMPERKYNIARQMAKAVVVL